MLKRVKVGVMISFVVMVFAFGCANTDSATEPTDRVSKSPSALVIEPTPKSTTRMELGSTTTTPSPIPQVTNDVVATQSTSTATSEPTQTNTPFPTATPEPTATATPLPTPNPYEVARLSVDNQLGQVVISKTVTLTVEIDGGEVRDTNGYIRPDSIEWYDNGVLIGRGQTVMLFGEAGENHVVHVRLADPSNLELSQHIRVGHFFFEHSEDSVLSQIQNENRELAHNQISNSMLVTLRDEFDRDRDGLINLDDPDMDGDGILDFEDDDVDGDSWKNVEDFAPFAFNEHGATYYSIGMHPDLFTLSESINQLELAKEIGVTSIRIDGDRGSKTQMRDFLFAANEMGFEVLAIYHGQDFGWTNIRRTAQSYSLGARAFIEEFGQLLAGIELTNEPNSSYYGMWREDWDYEQAGNIYGQMVIAAYQEIREVNPTITIVTAGLSPLWHSWGFNPEHVPLLSFLEDMVTVIENEFGLIPKDLTVGVHMYPFPPQELGGPEWGGIYPSDPNRYFYQYDSVAQTQAIIGREHPIAVTETLIDAGGWIYEEFGRNERAIWLDETLDFFAGNNAIEMVSVHVLASNNPDEEGWVIASEDFEPFPEFYAYQMYIQRNSP